MNSVQSFQRDLEQFLALAEELSFHRAAASLYIGQPALSNRIKQLESGLGVQLFDRAGRGVTLTAAGEAFVIEARELLGHVDRSLGTCRRAARRTSCLSVGYCEAVIGTILPGAMTRFRESQPSVDLSIFELPVSKQVTQLVSGRLDIGFLRPPAEHPELCLETLWVEPIVACVPRDHLLAGRTAISLADLAGEPLLSLAKDHPQEEQLRSILEPGGLLTDTVRETNRCSTMLHLAAAGVGIGVMAASTASAGGGQVSLVPITGVATALFIAWNANRVSAGGEVFLECARQVAEPWSKMLAATGRDIDVRDAAS